MFWVYFNLAILFICISYWLLQFQTQIHIILYFSIICSGFITLKFILPWIWIFIFSLFIWWQIIYLFNYSIILNLNILISYLFL